MALPCLRHVSLRLLVTVSALVLLLGPAAGRYLHPGIASASGTLGFGASTLVEDQRLAGEPDVKVCGPTATWSYGNCARNNPYASMPWGFSTTSSFIWRSEDQGKTFKLVPSNSGTGKPDACPGGGDTELAVSPGASQSSDYLNYADLQALTNFSTATSKDGGQTFLCNSLSSIASAVDRQWLGIYRNPSGAPGNGSVVYLDYDIASGSSIYPSTNCALSKTAAGNAFVIQKSTDGGNTWSPFAVVDCNDGVSGPIEVNQTSGHVFAIHTAYVNPANTVSTDAVVVNSSTDGGTTWTKHVVHACVQTATVDCTIGQDFAVLTIDKAGGLYAVWSQAPTDASGNVTGPSHIYYSYSGNDAATWSAPVRIDTTTNVSIFPWIAAGNAGAIDVVWYGTNKSASATGWDPSSQKSFWFPYISQSLNANTGTPTFSAPVQVAQHSNHYGGICTSGIGCTTGGDRSLADFFQVAVNQQGGADVIWADTSNNGNTTASGNAGSLIDESRQISGPTLFGTTLSGTAPMCSAITTTPCVSDPTGDAKYEANGMIGPNDPHLDLTGASLSQPSYSSNLLDARFNLANLSSLPAAGETGLNATDQYVDYLMSWNYHIPGNTDATFDSTGNVYYAYLEVNTATGAVTAYDGTTCSIDTTKPKYLVYPGQNAINYKIDKAAGTIDLFIPLSQVGSPPDDAALYSVTAHTVGQAGPAGPNSCPRNANGNNPDPSGQIFDVYDKSKAFTSIL